MKRNFSIPTVIALLLVGGLLGANLVTPAVGQAPGSFLRRFAANFTTFGNPPELVTTEQPAPNGGGGEVIYDKDVTVPGDVNVMYVTVSAVGDTHFGARLQLACLIDDVPCNPGANPIGGAMSGWVTVQRHKDYNLNYAPGGEPFVGDGGGGAGDLHDNTVYYTWCAPLEGQGAGTRNVKVKFASGAVPGEPASEGAEVFLEGVHFFVDGNRIADETAACQPLPQEEVAGAAAEEAHGDEGDQKVAATEEPSPSESITPEG